MPRSNQLSYITELGAQIFYSRAVNVNPQIPEIQEKG
jgi:hypothetical protein